MIIDFVVPALVYINVDGLWFQQYGATCHTANQTINLLKAIFDKRIISHRGPVAWTLRSCDFTPLFYFLLGYVTPEMIDALILKFILTQATQFPIWT